MSSIEHCVIFHKLKACYSLDESILVILKIPHEVSVRDTDWVGLIPAGWTNIHHYVTFEWLREGVRYNRSTHYFLLFRPEHHSDIVAQATNQLFQFIYVSKQIDVLGVSGIFKFEITSSSLDINRGALALHHIHWKPKLQGFAIELLLRCSRAEVALERCRAHQETLMHCLDKQKIVQIVGRGRKILVKKVNDTLLKIKTIHKTSAKLSNRPSPMDVKYKMHPIIAVVQLIKKFCLATKMLVLSAPGFLVNIATDFWNKKKRLEESKFAYENFKDQKICCDEQSCVLSFGNAHIANPLRERRQDLLQIIVPTENQILHTNFNYLLKQIKTQ